MFMTKISRRTFIGGSAAMGALLTSPELVKALTSQPYPRVKVANIRNLRVGEPVSFNYPDETLPQCSSSLERGLMAVWDRMGT